MNTKINKESVIVLNKILQIDAENNYRNNIEIFVSNEHFEKVYLKSAIFQINGSISITPLNKFIKEFNDESEDRYNKNDLLNCYNNKTNKFLICFKLKKYQIFNERFENVLNKKLEKFKIDKKDLKFYSIQIFKDK